MEEQFYLVWPLVMGWLLSRRSRDRVPDLSRWLLLAAVAITVVTGLLYYPGPLVSPADTPDAYWHVFGRAISKTDTLYLSTLHPCDRPARRRRAGDAVAAAGGVRAVRSATRVARSTVSP